MKLRDRQFEKALRRRIKVRAQGDPGLRRRLFWSRLQSMGGKSSDRWQAMIYFLFFLGLMIPFLESEFSLLAFVPPALAIVGGALVAGGRLFAAFGSDEHCWVLPAMPVRDADVARLVIRKHFMQSIALAWFALVGWLMLGFVMRLDFRFLALSIPVIVVIAVLTWLSMFAMAMLTAVRAGTHDDPSSVGIILLISAILIHYFDGLASRVSPSWYEWALCVPPVGVGFWVLDVEHSVHWEPIMVSCLMTVALIGLMPWVEKTLVRRFESWWPEFLYWDSEGIEREAKVLWELDNLPPLRISMPTSDSLSDLSERYQWFQTVRSGFPARLYDDETMAAYVVQFRREINDAFRMIFDERSDRFPRRECGRLENWLMRIWLTPRERDIFAFMAAGRLEWGQGLKRALSALLVGVAAAVLLSVFRPEAELGLLCLGIVVGMAVFCLPFNGGSLWRGWRLGTKAGEAIPACFLQPIAFYEMYRTVWKANSFRCLAGLPIVVLGGALVYAVAGLGLGPGLMIGLKVGLTIWLAQPVLILIRAIGSCRTQLVRSIGGILFATPLLALVVFVAGCLVAGVFVAGKVSTVLLLLAATGMVSWLLYAIAVSLVNGGYFDFLVNAADAETWELEE